MRLLLSFALLMPLALAAAPGRAAESYDNCTGFVDSLPADISTPGTWCLRKDLATAITSGAAVEIKNNNITLDCNHFKLGGLAAGDGTATLGVFASSRLGVTVRNCNIRGFRYGVYFAGGGGHVIEHNRLEGNTFLAINTTADGTLIRDNQVVDTGNSTAVTSQAAGIFAAGAGSHVLDNTVSGVEVLGVGGEAYGIYFSASSGSVGRNRVSGLDPDTTGIVYGVFSPAGPSVIHDNVLQGVAGNPVAVGVYCLGNQSTAHANLIGQFANGVANCLDSGNVVNPN